MHLKRNSVDSDAKLNIVQKAILSYEGNLTLLSPETQRRLKLVNEKVKAQTDDDKIIKSKIHNGDTKRSKVLQLIKRVILKLRKEAKSQKNLFILNLKIPIVVKIITPLMSGTYQNIVPKESFKKKKENFGDWTDLSDEENVRSSVSSNQSSTLKRKKNKRHVNHRNSQNASETKKQQQMNDTISFTDSNDTLINDQVK
ncbi:rho guanine nucleotide exchange factor 26 [Caerostris extrusa]|uniref:Rho guanine nucleotide exchange factor 26 n=1 Tax=Caerostris extrusa TaxID=172846 RepID=A0AAV4YAI0_CAEEX|nr:rho guanine nucleotide exchange factor 26 [Caerostris extrusa]